MAKIVLLPRSISAPSALDLYGRLLTWPARELVPLAALPGLQSEIEASLGPAQLYEVEMAVAALGASLKMPGTIEDPERFGEAMAIELAEYPADILTEAIRHARRTLDWFPSIKEMIAICDQLIGPRREQRRVVTWMIHEHQRRQDEADRSKGEAEAEARREAERDAQLGRRRERLRNLEFQAREHFGDDGPLPGDVELAESLSAEWVNRLGRKVSWLLALEGGEHWAAKFCRLIALAARVKQALEQGRVSWDGALAIAKMIPADEANARRQIEDFESSTATHPGDQPAESFWRALWKIHSTCGLDVPRFPEDAAAAAIESLKHLTGLAELADTRAILDHQVREQWERQQPALARVLWRGDDQTQERN
jgi:hypothetical protein